MVYINIYETSYLLDFVIICILSSKKIMDHKNFNVRLFKKFKI